MVLLTLLVLPSTACRLLESKKEKAGIDPVAIAKDPNQGVGPMSPFELQSRVRGFADGFAMGLRQPVTHLEEALGGEHAAHLHRWLSSHATTAIILASGPNPLVNLLDLAGMATLARMSIEDYWVPEVFGDAGKKLLDYHRQYEGEIWKIADDVLSEEQLGQLRNLIQEWRDTHPDQRAASFVSICDYAKERWHSPVPETENSRSLLRMVYLDPLSNLDPTTRQIAQTRDLAERLIYFLQRSPAMARLQVEMLYYDLTGSPEFQQVFTDITEFRKSTQQFVDTLEALPEKLSQAQRDLLDDLGKDERQWTELSQEYSKTFTAGAEMAASVAQAIQTLDAYTARVTADSDEVRSVPASASPELTEAAPAGKPFDVLEYAEAAEEVATASKNLEATIQSLEKLVASPAWESRQKEFNQLLAEIEGGAERVTERVFLRALVLVGVFLVGVLVVVLVYGKVRRKDPGLASPAKTTTTAPSRTV